ncbi:MAG: DUF4625 domain-containing protein [Aequorivita sp.]
MKTNTMKLNFKFLALIAFTAMFITSCSSDDGGALSSAPVISNFEYGTGSSHTADQIAYKGSDIHIEAKIYAEASVNSIRLSIHAQDLLPGNNEIDWHFEQVFTDAKYLVINPTFHEHVDVPANIPAGEYHIELTVTDEMGNSTKVEGHIQILDPITLSDFSMDDTVVRGDDFHTEFTINAVNGIHNISIDVHSHGLVPVAGEIEWHYQQIFTQGYHELTDVRFHEHIDVPITAPAGEYHIIITVEDEEGGTKEYETHIDVTA